MRAVTDRFTNIQDEIEQKNKTIKYKINIEFLELG